MLIIFFVFILLFLNLLILNKETFNCKFIPIGDSLEDCVIRCKNLKNKSGARLCVDNNTCLKKCNGCGDTPNKCTWFTNLCTTLTSTDSCNEMNFACFWDKSLQKCKERKGNKNALMTSCDLKQILKISDKKDLNTNNNYLIVETNSQNIQNFMVLYYNTKNSNGINISLIDNNDKTVKHSIYLNSNELFDSKNNSNYKNIINLKKGNYIFYIYYNDTSKNCFESNSEEVTVN